MGRLTGALSLSLLANLPPLATSGGKKYPNPFSYLSCICHCCHYFQRSRKKVSTRMQWKSFSKVVAMVASPPLIQVVLRKQFLSPIPPPQTRSIAVIDTNQIGMAETADFPIHRIQEARDGWRQIYEGLQLIESHLESGALVPPDSIFGGMLGREWQPRLAELPERLIVNLSTRVLPATTACCRYNESPLELRDFEQSAVLQITGIMTDAERAEPQIRKACNSRPQRRTQLSALQAAQNLLAGVLMVLDDILMSLRVMIGLSRFVRR